MVQILPSREFATVYQLASLAAGRKHGVKQEVFPRQRLLRTCTLNTESADKCSNTTRVLLTHGDSARETATNRSPRGGQRSQPGYSRDEQVAEPALLVA